MRRSRKPTNRIPVDLGNPDVFVVRVLHLGIRFKIVIAHDYAKAILKANAETAGPPRGVGVVEVLVPFVGFGSTGVSKSLICSGVNPVSVIDCRASAPRVRITYPKPPGRKTTEQIRQRFPLRPGIRYLPPLWKGSTSRTNWAAASVIWLIGSLLARKPCEPLASLFHASVHLSRPRRVNPLHSLSRRVTLSPSARVTSW